MLEGKTAIMSGSNNGIRFGLALEPWTAKVYFKRLGSPPVWVVGIAHKRQAFVKPMSKYSLVCV